MSFHEPVMSQHSFPNKTHFLFFQSLSPVIRTHLYTTHPHISTYWVHICVFLKKKNAYVYIHKYVVCTPLYTTRLHLSMYKCMNMYAVRTFENITQTRITCVFAQPVACNTNTFEHIWTHLNTFEHIWTHLNTFEHIWTQLVDIWVCISRCIYSQYVYLKTSYKHASPTLSNSLLQVIYTHQARMYTQSTQVHTKHTCTQQAHICTHQAHMFTHLVHISAYLVHICVYINICTYNTYVYSNIHSRHASLTFFSQQPIACASMAGMSLSGSLRLFCHVPLKRDLFLWDSRMRLSDTPHAIIGCDMHTTFIHTPGTHLYTHRTHTWYTFVYTPHTHQKLLGCGFSTPGPLFCLICTITSNKTGHLE